MFDLRFGDFSIYLLIDRYIVKSPNHQVVH